MTKVILRIDIEDSNWHKAIQKVKSVVQNVKKIAFTYLQQHEKLAILNVKKPLVINLCLSNNDRVHELNRNFRKIDKSTNVLSFANMDFIGFNTKDNVFDEVELGDIIIAYEKTKEEAESEKISFNDHFCHLLVHGILHVLGYDHVKDEQAQQMEALEAKILEQMNIRNPYRKKGYLEKLGEIWQKVITKMLVHRKTLSLCMGVLLAFCLPPFNQWGLLFVVFSTELFLCCQTNSAKKLSALGYWFGFGYFAAGFYWIGNALLVDAAATGWLYPITLLLNGAFFGLFTIAPFLSTKLANNNLSKILLFAAVWCMITEWTRGFLLTGFPWNPISSIVSFSPAMLQTLAIWGTYGLSLVLVLLSSLPAIWLLNPNKKTALILIITFLAMDLLWEYGSYILVNRPYVQDGNSLLVRLVQPSIPQSLKWSKEAAEDNLQKYIELSKGGDSRYIDFTVWGETASPFDLTYDIKKVQKIKQAVPNNGYLITGFLRYDIGNTAENYVPYNSLAVLNKKGQIVDIYDKSHLVPFGEYIPFRKYLPQWVKPLASNVSEFGHGEAYKTINIEGYPEFAPLICYEVVFSGQVANKQNKPKWMVVLTNDGWYGNSAGPYQHLAAAQMRAVEEGVSVVRSANSGISAVITPYGLITAQIPLGEVGAIDAIVKPDAARETLFGHYGNIIPLMMSLLLAVLSFLISTLSFKIKKH